MTVMTRAHLTDRQHEIMTLVSQGRNLPEIASTLGLTYPAAANEFQKAKTRIHNWKLQYANTPQGHYELERFGPRGQG